MDSATQALYQFRELLNTPAGLVSVLAFFVLLVAAGTIKKLKWVLLSLLLFASANAPISATEELQVQRALSFPLDTMRTYSRPLSAGLLVVLVAPAVLAPRGWRMRLVSSSVIAYLVYELTVSCHLLVSGLISRGLVGPVLFVLIFVVLGVGLSRWLQNWDDVYALLKSIVAMGVIFLLTTIYQLSVNPEAIVWADRLTGTTNNPQAAGILIATSLPPACFLLTRRGESMLWRIGLAATVGFLLVFLIWTGSRTGVLTALVGLGLLFRARLGRLTATAIVTGVFALLAMELFSQSTGAASRLLSLENTRAHVWRLMLADFLASPITGGHTEAYLQRGSANSYLLTAARFGLVGLLPLVVTVGLIGRQLWLLHRARSQLGETAMLVDLVTAGVASLLVSAMFEGFLVGILTPPVFLLYIYMTMAGFLLDVVRYWQGRQLHIVRQHAPVTHPR